MPLTAAQRRSLVWCAVAVGTALLLWLLAPVLTPFVIAAVLAYALHPAVEALAARRVPRLAAVIMIEALAIAALLALVLLLVPVFAKELPLLREQIPLLADRANQHLTPWLAQHGLDMPSVLPLHLFVDPQGRVRCARSGAVNKDAYDAIVALAGAAP